MKKILLLVSVMIALAFSVNAVVYMRVETSDSKVDKYDVEKVDEVYCIGSEVVNGNGGELRVRTTDGNVIGYDLTKLKSMTFEGSGSEGFTISGKVGDYSYVDLGLSVKWATYNIGASRPAEYGDYFAWGETEPIDECGDWEAYKWSYFDKFYRLRFSKYCHDRDDGDLDKRRVLETEDDAATVNWGAGWRMPTKEEQMELIQGCDWMWVENVDGSDVAGLAGTSKKNGNTIFLPASGNCYLDDNTPSHQNRSGNYWSSSLDLSATERAESLFIDFSENVLESEVYEGGIRYVYDYYIDVLSELRSYGCSVRAVVAE